MAKIPAKIGKYVITNKVAEGGMGAVYKGVHPTLNRDVILKKLTLSGDKHITERFKREARIMMDFKNDNIVDVYDHFKAGGSYYIVLEFVDGMALDGLIKKERYLPNDTALLIFLECCKALHYAHNKNVIHRDIKPGNILISKKGEVKLVDFGIASITDDDESNLTRDGMTLGTPSYMAPEQFNNSKTVDRRADIYSMGIMLYEMVTGKKPYPGNYSPETLAKIQKGKYQPPQKSNPHISSFVAKLISKCMKAKADKRFKDLSRVILILEKYFKKKGKDLPEKILIAKITGKTIQVPKRAKAIGKKIVIVLSSVLILASLVFLLYWSGFYHELLTSSSHGALVVQVKIPKSGKEFKDFYLKAQLFNDDNNEIPEIESKIRFRIKDETKSYFILESNKLYQPAGDYRVKIKYENKLFWNSFFLDPINRTKRLSGGSKIQVEQIEAGVIQPGELLVNVAVYDYSKGGIITDKTKTTVKINDKWISLSDYSEKFISGKVYYFNFQNPDYYSKRFNLKIDHYQSELIISTKLIPKEGSISISSADSRIRLEIDNSSYYLDGGVETKYKDLKTLSEENLEISLFPGKYLFRFYRGNIEKEVALNVDKNTDIHLDVSFNKENKTITIEGI